MNRQWSMGQHKMVFIHITRVTKRKKKEMNFGKRNIFEHFTFAKFRSSKKYKGWIVERVLETVDKNPAKHQGRKLVDCRGKNEVWCWWYSRNSQGEERVIGMGRAVTLGLIKV